MTVYLIRHHGDDALKIGHTDNDPMDRLHALQAGSASILELVATIPGAPQQIEQALHRHFAGLRVRPNSDWFQDHFLIRVAFECLRAACHMAHLEARIQQAQELLSLDSTLNIEQLDSNLKLCRALLDRPVCDCAGTEVGAVPDEITFLTVLTSTIDDHWEGTGGALHGLLSRPDNDNPWPQPRGISAQLRRHAPELRASGWHITEYKPDPKSKRPMTWVLIPPAVDADNN